MRIVNETTMTYEHLMEFNQSHRRKLRMTLHIFIGICLCLQVIKLVTNVIRYAVYLGILPPADVWAVSLVYIAFLVFFLIYPTIRRRRNCRKQADRHMSATYVFTQEGYEEIAFSDMVNGHDSCKYDIITKVTESEHFFYLYIGFNVAHIVDKRGFTEGSEYDFRMLLRSVIDSKKLHIK